MFEQALAIVRNTFFESIRQPIMLVMLVVATLAIVLSNPLSGYTMEDDQRMLVDIGLATVFICGTLLAAFIATSVLTREIENRTALTVVAKPVPRPVFVIGKYLGVSGAILLATLYMSLVFLLVEMHGVLSTARTPLHLPVIFFGVGAGLLAVIAATWCNYFYNMVFASTLLCILTPLAALAYLLAMMFGPEFEAQHIGESFKPHFWLALMAMYVALLVLTAVAIAASTRLSQVMTLVVTLGMFLVGMLSDWIFGRRLESLEATWLERAKAAGETETVERTRVIRMISGEISEPLVERIEQPLTALTEFASSAELLVYWLLKIPYSILPNVQTMVLIDALTQGHVIPGSYVASSAMYGLFCVILILSIAVILFQRREVG